MKKRAMYFAITLVVMLMGLLSRKFMFVFPKDIAPFVGDALWAMMVYFGFRFSLAIAFSFAIEISQLYQSDWINAVRNTTLGALVLGHGFLWFDLVSYSIGIIIAVMIDKVLNIRISKL